MEKSEEEECTAIVKALMRDENAYPFLTPVDPIALGCPTYFDVIKNPMDFETITVVRFLLVVTNQNKLENREYESPQQVFDDIRLIFSNCLLFNKGTRSRGIRKMAIDLRTKFEKLVAKAKCADPSKDWEATPREVWKQCDRCLKWRRVEVVGKQPYRWKCGDDGTPYSCDMPEEKPLNRKVGEDNAFMSTISNLLQSRERRIPSLSENQVQNMHEEIEADVFSHFIQTAWICSSLSPASVISEYAALALTPFLLFKATRTRKKGSLVLRRLRAKVPALPEAATEKQVMDLYRRTVEPFEKGWQLLSSPRRGEKREVPSLEEAFRGKAKGKPMTVTPGVFCWRCQADIELFDEKVFCAGCGAPCCRECFSGDASDARHVFCDRCGLLLSPSWNELACCTVCGLGILPAVTDSWVRCTQCRGFAHRACLSHPVEEPKQWVCDDCKRLRTEEPSAVCRLCIDPQSRIISPVFTEN